jgi:hypothetical protein
MRPAVAVLPALVAAALAGGCRAACEPRVAEVAADPALSAATGYLESLRRAAEERDPGAAERFQLDRREYQEWRDERLAELAAHPYLADRPGFSTAARLGWDTWFHWTAGNQYTWRDLAQRSDGRIQLLRLLDNDQLDRDRRFERFGLINDPDGRPPERDAAGRCLTDAYGLCLDRFDEPAVSVRTERWLGRPSGVLGLRLFDNQDYRPGTWDPADPWSPPAGCDPGARPGRDPAATARESREDCYQPPLLVGVSCGFCHISFHPENPPPDPRRPRWEHVVGGLGNVYLKEGPLFAWVLDFGPGAFYTHYLEAQPPGTSDTSRIATDDLDNPGAINALVHLTARLAEAEEETLPHGGTEAVPRVLKDGADSTGLALAALRVYVNIGMLGNDWLNRHDAYLLLAGKPRPQEPFPIATAMITPGYDGAYAWNQTEARLPDLSAWLHTLEPFRLERAPGGTGFLTRDPAILARGRRVFADHCAACHSSQQPAVDRRADPAAFRAALRELVESDGFFDGNFLSDDRRYPATAIGVNLTRSLAGNALQGHIWQDFSSLSYKRLPSLGRVLLPDPFDPGGTLELCAPEGGRGYYRTASLAGLWATAPFFHNNAVGRHRHDPSVAARVAAFEDAAEQLLWPERRTGPEGTPGPYIKRTPDRVTWLPLPDGLEVPVPPRYPIKVVGNLPLHELAARLPRPLQALLLGEPGTAPGARRERIARQVLANSGTRRLLRQALLDLNAAPDFVENKGHEAIVAAIGSDEDKRALIELMKTF